MLQREEEGGKSPDRRSETRIGSTTTTESVPKKQVSGENGLRRC